MQQCSGGYLTAGVKHESAASGYVAKLDNLIRQINISCLQANESRTANSQREMKQSVISCSNISKPAENPFGLDPFKIRIKDELRNMQTINPRQDVFVEAWRIYAGQEIRVATARPRKTWTYSRVWQRKKGFWKISRSVCIYFCFFYYNLTFGQSESVSLKCFCFISMRKGCSSRINRA